MNSEPSIVSVDHTALHDLMFWEQIARALQKAAVRASAPIILLGSGEQAEAATGGILAGDVRAGGELPVSGDTHAAFERAIREQNKMAVARLTDAGISTVGFLGADRGLFFWREGQLRLGAWNSVVSLATSGVVCVVSCVAAGAVWTDIHPLRVAAVIREKMEYTMPYTLMSQRVTKGMKEPGRLYSMDGIRTIIDEGGLPGEVSRLIGEPVLVEHASRWSPFSNS